MKKLHIASIAAALLYLGLAAPSQASVILAFSDTGLGASGDISATGPVPGSSDNITGLLANFDTFTISGAPSGNGSYSSFFTEEYCTTGGSPACVFGESTGIIYVYGSLQTLNSNLSGTGIANALLTITLSGGLSANVVASPGLSSLNFPTDIASVVINPTLAADLGLTGVNLVVTGMTNNMTTTAPNSFISTASLTLGSTATPEPGSWMMMALGIAAMGFVARRKLSPAAIQA